MSEGDDHQERDGLHGPVEREPSEEEVECYRQVFAEYDTSGDGTIAKEELATALRDCGLNPTEDELTDMIADVDDNHDGVINYDEFLHFCKCLRSPEEEHENLMQAFKTFDTDDSGYLELEELRGVLGSCGEGITDEELQDLLNDADVNGDGKIDYKEFANLMKPERGGGRLREEEYDES